MRRGAMPEKLKIPGSSCERETRLALGHRLLLAVLMYGRAVNFVQSEGLQMQVAKVKLVMNSVAGWYRLVLSMGSW